MLSTTSLAAFLQKGESQSDWETQCSATKITSSQDRQPDKKTNKMFPKTSKIYIGKALQKMSDSGSILALFWTSNPTKFDQKTDAEFECILASIFNKYFIHFGSQKTSQTGPKFRRIGRRIGPRAQHGHPKVQ